jgi:peptidoglycan/LPS O-acetylase OafA/YrhL
MPAKPTLSALTGLRFFAALAIFNFHIGYFVPGTKPASWHFLQNVDSACISGVSLFFVLSGFILAYAHEDMSLSRQSILTFWIGRFSRIYPVYLLGLIWYAPFILQHRFAVESPAVAAAKSLGSLLPSLFLIQSWFHPRSAIAWNGPGWTLSVETVFYLLFPLLAGRIRSLGQGALIACACTLWAVSMAMSLLVPRLLADWTYLQMFVSFNPLFHLPTFAIGIALGFHFLRSDSRAGYSWTPLLGLAGVAVLTTAIGKFPELVVHNCLFVPAFAVLIYGLAQRGMTAGFFSLPAVVLLGEASYSFYILQFPQGLTFRLFNEQSMSPDYVAMLPAGGLLHGWVGYVILLLATATISIVIFKRFEVPMRIGIRRRLTSRLTAVKSLRAGPTLHENVA